MAETEQLFRISEQLGRVLDAQERATEDRRETKAALDRINDRVNAISRDFASFKLEIDPVKKLSKDYNEAKSNVVLFVIVWAILCMLGGGGGALMAEAVKIIK